MINRAMWVFAALSLGLVPTFGADVVQFQYQFPTHFSAIVSTTRTMATDVNDRIVTSSIRSVYELAVTPSGNNFRHIRYRSIGRSVENASSPTAIPFYKALIDISDRYFQSVLVTSSANLQFQNFNQSLDQATRAAYRLAKTPEARKVVDSVFDADGIQYSEEDQWMRMVQMWDGVSATIGIWYQARGSEYIPQIGRVVPSDFFFRVRSRVPCGLSNDCVLIEAKSVPDLAKVISGDPSGPDSKNPIQAPRFVTVFSVVTDAKTLRPVLYTETRESMVGMQLALSTVRTTFQYRPR